MSKSDIEHKQVILNTRKGDIKHEQSILASIVAGLIVITHATSTKPLHLRKL